MNLTTAQEEMLRLSRLIDQGITAMADQARELADAENAYRLAKAQAFLVAPEGTVAEREAWVGGHTSKERHRRDLADGMRQAATEAVRSRRTQLSAWQTLMNVSHAEMEFDRQAARLS